MKVFGLWFLVFSLLCAGCITTDVARQDEVAQVRSGISEELIGVKEEVRSLGGKIEELQQEIDRLSRTQSQQSNELNTTLKEWHTKIKKDVEKETGDIKNRLETVEKTQKQNKKELQNKLQVVVEEVTKENKELRKQIESIRKTTAYTGTEGYYVVTEGDTLSEIAQMFGVSVKSIMEANHITDPNSIRTGQKLIIPGKKK